MPDYCRSCGPVLLLSVLLCGCQPQDEQPGFWIEGSLVEESVTDWAFATDVEEILIQTGTWYGIPHSTTIWCVVYQGELYIGSYGAEKKAWEENIARDPTATLGVGEKLYPVTVSLLSDSELVSKLDLAYQEKYDMAAVFGDEVPGWWYYRITQ